MKNNHGYFQVQAHALTDKGRRPNNEDFITSFEPTDPQERQRSGCIYIVADGVGGASVGERASQYAAEKVLYEYFQHPEIEPGARLKQAITRVNREIFQYAKDKGMRMATTITVAVVLDNSLIAANVGDSRTYLIRGNVVNQVTQDHNIVGEMVRDGVMTEAEALHSKAKNRLTRSIGGDEEVHVDIFGPIPLQTGDKIVLCSDGLTRYALKEDITSLATSGSPEQITEKLVAFAKERGHGGADNISVITVAYEPSAALVATVQLPRPVAPVQPWEVMETNILSKPPAPKPQAPKPQMAKWIALSAIGLLGIGLLSITALTIVTWPSALILFGATTPTLTLTISPAAPSPSPVITLTTPSATPATPPPPVTVQTTPEAPTGPIINCPIGFPNVSVRSQPSTINDDSVLGNLDCGKGVVLTGMYISNENKEWFQINYTDAKGQSSLAWVVGSRVDVEEHTKAALPVLDFFGVTVTPMPIQVQESQEDTNLIKCSYKVASGDSLSKIAQKFGIGGNNYSKIACATESKDCDLTDPSKINPEWQVVIPDISDKVCTSNGGTVLP
jgi:protein phosphatase